MALWHALACVRVYLPKAPASEGGRYRNRVHEPGVRCRLQFPIADSRSLVAILLAALLADVHFVMADAAVVGGKQVQGFHGDDSGFMVASRETLDGVHGGP